MNERVNGDLQSAIEGFNMNLNWTREYSQAPESVGFYGSKAAEGQSTQIINARFNLKTGLWQLQGCENMIASDLPGILNACAAKAREIEVSINAKLAQ